PSFACIPAPSSPARARSTRLGTRKRISAGYSVFSPPDIVFEVLSDHSLRLQWMQGSKEVVYFGQQLNRVGTKHRCIVDKDSPVMVTSKFMRDSEKIIFAETDEAKKMCSVYTIRKINDGQTSVRVDGLLKNNLLLRLFFNLKLKKKICAFFDASMRNLKRYCEDLYIKQQV
ncbi:MAG: SRPBCC family protein, partial [Ignavibacteriaceae bacterium]